MTETIVLQTGQKDLLLGSLDFAQGTINNLKTLKEFKDYAHFTFNQDRTVCFASKTNGTDSQIDIFHLEDSKWRTVSTYNEENIQIADLTFNEEEGLIYAVSCGSASLTVFQLSDDWAVEMIDQVIHRSEKKISPEPHQVKISPEGAWIIVTDSSTDCIYTYELVKGVVLREVDRVHLGEDFSISGFDFHPHLDIAYAVSRLRGEILTMEYDSKNGSFSPFLNMSTLGEDALGEDQAEENQAAGKMIIDSKGSYIYVLNQKKPSIAVYNIHPRAGATQLQQVYGLDQTREPCDIYLTSDDRHLMVSYLNQDTGTLLDSAAQTGKLVNERELPLHDNQIKFL